MYLRKLELHGFKSFADRTALLFDPGVTAIVGPNGCGKSNIVDAVRWVIGEQRARILRSEKMENVIFNGTASKRPLGMAEVMLTIENTRSVLPVEYTEVTLGRRLFRSGESEYLLNGVKCRLQDILDLFMDTGMGAGAYSVIELKMIEEILSENAQDRRRLFEEAAGVTRYKLRRKQTLSKLGDTQADLTRLNDLTEEVGKLVRTLKRQAERAARFKEYDARLRELELALAQAEYDRLKVQQDRLEGEAASLGERIAAATEKLAQEEASLEELRKELSAREHSLGTQRQRLGAHRESVRSAEADLRLEGERREAYGRDLDRLVQERAEAGSRLQSFEETAARLKQQLSGLEPAVEEAGRRLQAAEEERDRTRAAADEHRKQLQDLRRTQEAAEQEHAQRRRGQDRAASRIEVLQQEQARHRTLLDEMAGGGEELEARARLAAKQMEEASVNLETAKTALDEATAAREANRQALDAVAEAVRQVERRRDAAAAELSLLDSLMASYEDFAGPVQYLAANPGWAAAPLRTVSDVLTCAEDARLALDAALGEFASCIVAATEQKARQAAALLREQEQGQALFIVLDRLHVLPAHSRPPVSGPRPLLDLAGVVDPAYQPVAEALLRDSYLVASLEEAESAAAVSSAPARFITPSGEWIASTGIFKGGSPHAGASPVAARLARREQRDAAHALLADLEAEWSVRSAEAERLTATRGAIPYEARREAFARAQQNATDAERLLERARMEQNALAKRGDEVASRLRTLDADLEKARGEIESFSEGAGEMETALVGLRQRRAALEERNLEADAESRAALTRFNEASLAAVQARNRWDNLRAERDRTVQSLNDLTRRSASREKDLAAIQEQIRSTEKQADVLRRRLATLQSERSGLESVLAEADARVGKVRTAITNVEAGLRRLRLEREDFIRDEHQRDVRLAEIHTRIEDLVENIREHFAVFLTLNPVSLPPDFDEQAARTEVLDLRNQIKSLGGVNALALEDYEKEQERYDFLTAQQQDLRQAETSLLNTISEINTTASERFMETYEAIHANFKRIFEELFGEDAHADLQLADPSDPLESAIEIMAKPRGKRPSTIAQLSGGEKTLTAIALLFAIYLVKPSPFCILDEVDAPLDDTNVDRFMHLIREFSASTQFILVTHNKRSMELADRMYGITMQEQGVSRVVAVEFGALEPEPAASLP